MPGSAHLHTVFLCYGLGAASLSSLYYIEQDTQKYQNTDNLFSSVCTYIEASPDSCHIGQSVLCVIGKISALPRTISRLLLHDYNQRGTFHLEQYVGLRRTYPSFPQDKLNTVSVCFPHLQLCSLKKSCLCLLKIINWSSVSHALPFMHLSSRPYFAHSVTHLVLMLNQLLV